ncbi:MAG: DUF3520 domain-containing protein [Chlorobi bacterium]|nr:DUF3520 domain-containing protein [Chlorobiota bacterium]
MKKLLFIIVILLSTGNYLIATPFTVNGIVTDENNKPLEGVLVINKQNSGSVTTNSAGYYSIVVNAPETVLIFRFPGKETVRKNVNGKNRIDIILQKTTHILYSEYEYTSDLECEIAALPTISNTKSRYRKMAGTPRHPVSYCMPLGFNTEGYSTIHENGFRSATDNPLSTFSADVDRASYSNIRRYLNNGSLPPEDAVRIEEMINYFNYNYKDNSMKHPFSVHTELAVCPWNKEHLLLKTGIKAKDIKKEELPPSNLVFLIDVSGSMQASNKLPLLKSSFTLLVDQLRPEDYVSIVVYAGAAGLVLEPTPGNRKEKILKAIENLQAGGSTAGGEGLRLAYQTAEKNFIHNGNNRIILATDGDFNIGESSNAAMERLIEEKRNKGIFISVLGFGTGNYKDDKMEIIADKGNGNYSYIDNIQEARKTLVSEFGGTLFTVASDVKFQIEFNPVKVAGYRLIGYENRLLNNEDFNDDKKDAGEIGAGHIVTVLYEIIPAGTRDAGKWIKSTDTLKYQNKNISENNFRNEWLTIKLRYKKPGAGKSTLITKTVQDKPETIDSASDNFRFAAAVAAFGMLLRNSEYIQQFSYNDAIQLASNSVKNDKEGFKSEMLRLMHTAQTLQHWTASE